MSSIFGVRGATLACLAVAALAGCSDRVLDHGLTGAFDDAPTPGEGPSPIRRMSGADKSYPNLASVPPRPTDFSTDAQLRSDRESLTQDRSQAESLQRAAGVPAPMEVPPPPRLTPGRP